jgi:chemotaxis protein methyltransferase CheR
LQSSSPTRLDARGAAQVPPVLGPRPLRQKEFDLFQALIYREAGIYLSQAKKALLAGRLNRRLRQLGMKTFNEYYRLVTGGDDEERVRMLDCICTNETQFFREPRQFELLENRVLPALKERGEEGFTSRKIRVWSAACSTGEEPYSLAMVLLAHFPPSSGWEIEILATDLSTRALETASQGIYPDEKVKHIPPSYLKTFVLKGTRSQAGKIKASPEIRSVVRFHRLNLNQPTYPIVGRFDLIFCRNALIYFHSESKARVVHRLLSHLAPDGHLFLGHAESLNGVTKRVRSVIPTVFAFNSDSDASIDEPIVA